MDTTEQKRGRKPKGWRAQTAAERQADRRARLRTAAIELDSKEWTEAVCLEILTTKKWRNGAIDLAAWQQLGKLRGFIS
jgi:hypothetical protein